MLRSSASALVAVLPLGRIDEGVADTSWCPFVTILRVWRLPGRMNLPAESSLAPATRASLSSHQQARTVVKPTDLQLLHGALDALAACRLTTRKPARSRVETYADPVGKNVPRS